MKILSPLSNGPIARLWTGLSLSAIGDQVQQLALIWSATKLLGSRAGFVASLETGSVLLVALFAGAWAERWDPRRSMITADLLRSALAIIPVAAAATGHLNPATLVVPCVALAGIRAVFDPALQASLPRLAPDRATLLRTNALMDATIRLARLFGPALAGLLATVVPDIGLMAVNAATFLGSAVAVSSLRRELPRRGPRRSDPTPVSRVEMLLGGIRAVSSKPRMAVLLVRASVVNGLWFVAIWLCLPLAVRTGQFEAWGMTALTAVGLVLGAYGAGNILGNLFVGELEAGAPETLICTGDAIVGLGLMLLALAFSAAPGARAPLAMAAAAFAALGGPPIDVPMATLRQTVFRGEDVAAVHRLTIVFDFGGILLATLFAPLLLTQLPPTKVLLGCGVGVLAITGLTQLMLASLPPPTFCNPTGASVEPVDPNHPAAVVEPYPHG